MIVEEIFETKIYPELKEYLINNSIYKPAVTKVHTQESKIFPIVTVNLMTVRNTYNNLSYGEETYTFGIDINVYAIDKDGISKRTICKEIVNKIVEYFKTNYHVVISIKIDLSTTADNIHRSDVRIRGKLDTKYENLVISPW